MEWLFKMARNVFELLLQIACYNYMQFYIGNVISMYGVEKWEP